MAPKPSATDSSGPSSNKRKGTPSTNNNNNNNNNGRSDAFQAKRAKIFAARNIPTQPAEVALKDGELDLAAFVAAHEFEIRALEQSMATTKAVSCSRAFQAVPRELRRRTASHNPKRVPKRLRARAKREMEEDNAPLVESRRRRPRTLRAKIRAQTRKRLYTLATRKAKRKEAKAKKASPEAPPPEGSRGSKPRPKIRRNMLNEPPKPPAKFRKRQINKTWLPTHRWHAKRARMTDPKEPLWRFAIPLTPNEKVYRPTHRAQGERGTLVWDMSYMSTIGLYGNSVGMERVLRRIGLSQESCWDDKGKKWRRGTRAWTGMLSSQAEATRRYMCPATVFWNPEPQADPQQPPVSESSEPTAPPPAEEEDDDDDDSKGKSTNKRKVQRQVYIRVHPSAFLQVFNELLRLTKMENPRLYIEDLRFEIGSLELTGPASTEALHAVLTPYPPGKSPQNKHAELFESLKGLSNPAALPANAVLHFSIQDPRLRYPPRKMEPVQDEEAAHTNLLKTIAKWPAEEDLQPSALFDRDARHAASCLPSQKAVNRRRSKANPGSFLKPLPTIDPPIPVTLVSSRSGSGTQTQGTWTLLAPWSCILPLWYSVVHAPLTSGANPRFAGLHETMQIAFERGCPWFPADFPGTQAGAEWERERARKRKWEWARRPKSKRPAWEGLDLGAGRKGEVGDGLKCDFEYLFGLSAATDVQVQGQVRVEEQEQEQDSTTREHDEAKMDIDAPPPKPQAEKQAAKQPESPPNSAPLTHIPKSLFNTLLSSKSSSSSLSSPPIPPNAIICVRLSMLGRGVARPCARIYRLPASNPLPCSPTAQVPASIPPPSYAPRLPHDLRAQWLSRASSNPTPKSSNNNNKSAPSDLATRTRLLAQELTAPAPSTNGLYPRPNQHDIDGSHPLVPDAEDLVGFVTTGAFNLADGQGSAVGGLALERILPGVRRNGREGRLCVVRNAGENVGWIARWSVV